MKQLGRLSELKEALDNGLSLEVQNGSGMLAVKVHEGYSLIDAAGCTIPFEWQDFIDNADFSGDEWVVVDSDLTSTHKGSE